MNQISNNMKNRKLKFIPYFILMAVAASLTFTSCDDEEDETMGNWERMSDFDGTPRSAAVCFTVGNNAFFGTGFDGKNSVALSDFWQYNVAGNYWTQKADFPGTLRYYATSFIVGTKGYVGLGYDRVARTNLKDFFEYDTQANEWKEIAEFPGTARVGAVSFAVGGKGYVGAGDDDSIQKDFYSYDPSSDTWTQIVSIGGAKRTNATSFVIGDKAYVMSGYENGTYLSDLWEFVPSNNENGGTWTRMRDIADNSDEDYDDEYVGIARIKAVGFTIDGKGYITAGNNSSSNLTTSWMYDPVTDLWEERTGLTSGTNKPIPRTEAVGFAIGSYGYVVSGKSSSSYFDDIWRFDPYTENDE